MNERIRQLAQQAQKVVGYTDGGYTEIKALDEEKFAELIVQECIEIAKDVNRNPYLDEHHHARQIIKNITKRFGVSEE